MKIVTGFVGEPHITSNDMHGFNQGVFGSGNYVLNVGQKFAATMTDATTVTLQDGEGMLQGVHFRIDPGTTESISISPGATGYNRIDLVCARYTKDVSTGIENVDLVVIEGTPSASTPSDPSYTAGDVLGGDTLAEFPLWKVTLTGLAPVLSQAYTLIETAEQISNKIITYSGTVSSVPALSPKSQVITTLPSNNYIILGLMLKYGNGSLWDTPSVTFEDDSDARLTITAYIDNNNKLVVVPYNNASSARDILYRVAIMKLPA